MAFGSRELSLCDVRNGWEPFDQAVLCSGSRSASRLPVITVASSSSSSHTASAARLVPERRDHRMLARGIAEALALDQGGELVLAGREIGWHERLWLFLCGRPSSRLALRNGSCYRRDVSRVLRCH